MTSLLNEASRRAIARGALLVAALAACADGARATAPIDPPAPPPPPAAPPSPPTIPTNLGPEFPPVPAGALAYDEADPDLYRFIFAYHGGRLRSRYVLREDGTFALIFSSPRFALFAYEGRYTPSGDRHAILDFLNGDRWFADIRFVDDVMHVEYSPLAQHSDFMNGTYLRVRSP